MPSYKWDLNSCAPLGTVFANPVTYIYKYVTYMCICSAWMRNLAGCATGFRLCNRTPGCITGRPDVLPESLPTYPVA